MAWTSPRTWVSGETPTAALLNTHIRDNFNALGDPWTSYTPTWTAGTTNPTLGNGTIVGAYVQVGQLVMFRILLTFGSTTTPGSGVYQFGLPANGNSSGFETCGTGLARDDSTTSYMTLTGRLAGSYIDAITGSGGRVNQTTPYTWGTGDTISFRGLYDAL